MLPRPQSHASAITHALHACHLVVLARSTYFGVNKCQKPARQNLKVDCEEPLDG